MGAVLGIFAGPYAIFARWAVIGLLVAAVAVFAWFKGDAYGTKKLTDYQSAQFVESTRVAGVRQVVTEKIVTKYITVAAKTQAVADTVKQEVSQYAEVNRSNCLDADWRVLHDTAVANAIPDAASRPDAAGGAPSAATAIATVTGNYSACQKDIDRLTALQDWIRQQQAVK